MEETEYALQTEGLGKKFGQDIIALDDVSIRIRKGEVVGYVGPNGSGKTTTIKILTNLIKPSSGHAYINNIDVNKNPKKALQSVGALIEVPGVYDYLTPHEMLVYFGKVYRMNKKDINRRIEEVLEMVKLSDWENRKIGGFSTGMQRRLAIAKAFFHDPDILILDEPVIGLDPKGIKEVRELIKKLQSEDTTVFLSSHLLKEVSDTCDSVVFLDNGKVITHDSVKNITDTVKVRKIDVRFLNPLSGGDLERLKNLELIEDALRKNGDVRIEYDGDPKTSYKILSLLMESGFEIVSFTPRTVSLEDYYVSKIGDERGVS
jgi:ABC-2 type transport system ATP-binding protein